MIKKFEEIAEKIESLRADLLLSEEGTALSCPEAEQFYLLAIGSLDSAERYVRLAGIKQADMFAIRKVYRDIKDSIKKVKATP